MDISKFIEEYSSDLDKSKELTMFIEVYDAVSGTYLDNHSFVIDLDEVVVASDPFSKKKDYIALPSLDDYLEEFPDMPEFDPEHPLDSIWNIIKWIGECLWVVVKNIFNFFKWLRDCFWVLLQNLGIALYNLAVDLKKLLSYLFIPNDSSLRSLVSSYKNKLGSKYEFYEQITAFFHNFNDNLSGSTNPPEWHFTWKDQSLLAVDFSGVSGVIDIVKDIILFIAWALFLKYLYKSIPSFIGSMPTDQQFSIISK